MIKYLTNVKYNIFLGPWAGRLVKSLGLFFKKNLKILSRRNLK